MVGAWVLSFFQHFGVFENILIILGYKCKSNTILNYKLICSQLLLVGGGVFGVTLSCAKDLFLSLLSITSSGAWGTIYDTGDRTRIICMQGKHLNPHLTLQPSVAIFRMESTFQVISLKNNQFEPNWKQAKPQGNA